MPYKDLKWPQIKAKKSPETWKKIDKAYNNRRNVKATLEKRAHELIAKIYRLSFIGNEGVAKTLRQEIILALRLPRGWNQKDYDKAWNRLNEAEATINDFARRNHHVNTDLLDAILVTFRLSKISVDEKLAVLAEAIRRLGNARETKKMTECEKNLANFIHILSRQVPDENYPAWFPEAYAKHGIALLTKEDRDKVIQQLTDARDMEQSAIFLQQFFEQPEDDNNEEI